MKRLLVSTVLLLFLAGCGHPAAIGFIIALSQPDKKDRPAGPAVEPLVITTATLSDAVNGEAYSHNVEATGGTPPYTWSISANTPPSPIAIDLDTGILSGTPGDTTGDFTFTVRVLDNASAAVTRVLTITLYDDLQITTGPQLPGAANTVPYGPVTIAATGGTGNYTWGITGGFRPNDLSLDPVSGQFSGTPNDMVGTYAFTVAVRDDATPRQTSTLQFSLDLYSPLSMVTTSLPTGAVGVAYTAPVEVTGGSGSLTWSLSGAPASLSIDSSTGIISGTPVTGEDGAHVFTAAVTDNSTGDSINRGFAVGIYEELQITSTSLPDGSVGVGYFAPVAATGGSGNATWSLLGAPASISIAPDTGLISGAPVSGQDGAYTFTVTITDAAAGSSDSQDFTVDIYGELQITTASFPDGTVGFAYSVQVDVTGGMGDLTWSLSGAPGSLSINSAGGLISGTPAPGDEGSYMFIVIVIDNMTGDSDRCDFPVEIERVLMITTPSLPDSYVGATYDETISAINGVTPYTWSWSGNTPSGLGIDSGTGVISGNPDTAGDYTFTVTITDSDAMPATDSKGFTIHVYDKLLITTTLLPDGDEGVLYNMTLSVTGGGSSSPTWSIVGGSLPSGLDINTSTGEIFGTPEPGTGDNTYNFRVRVADSLDSDEKDLGLTIIKIAPQGSADFAAAPISGAVPLDVSFTDMSIGTFNSWSWDFDNDGTTDSSIQHPLHQYTTAGWYTVKLTADGPEGSDSCTKEMYILAPNNIRYVDDTVSSSGNGTTWTQALKTIQEALDLAVDYDLILVADGTYTGTGNKNLDFGGRSVYLKSAGGASSCIVDCQDSGRAFYFHTGETRDSVLDGFTVRNGLNANGAGLRMDGASPTIANCIIEGCATSSWSSGGGFYIASGSAPHISACYIRDNQTADWTRGAGLYIVGLSNVTITNSIIANNLGNNISGGSGILCTGNSTVTLYNCTIANNGGGAGLWCENNWNPSSQVYAYNCIVANDDVHANASGYVDLYDCRLDSTSGGGVTQYNCISSDPLLVDPGMEGPGGYGDYRLQAISPCIDAGDNSHLPEEVRTDLDGNPRIVDGDLDTTATVDMGAYEKQ